MTFFQIIQSVLGWLPTPIAGAALGLIGVTLVIIIVNIVAKIMDCLPFV